MLPLCWLTSSSAPLLCKRASSNEHKTHLLSRSQHHVIPCALGKSNQLNPMQGSGIYSTVMSYVPGTEDYKKATQHSEEEHHKSSTVGNTGGTTADASAKTAGGAGADTNDYAEGVGTGSDYGAGKGERAGNYTTGHSGSDHGSGVRGTGGYGKHGTRDQLDGGDASEYGTTGAGYGSGTGSGLAGSYGSGSKGPEGYGTEGTGGTGKTYASGASEGVPYSSGTSQGEYGGSGYKHSPSHDDDTGTHHSGYNPKASTYDGTNTDQDQGQSEGVRGAPIQGDNVKGYAIGSQVGSGDTDNPSRPGDPSGQVAGSHIEYGPKDTDTRDATGHGTVGHSQGTGDSSFANVKTDDGQGNTSHVVTRQSTSHMTSSTVTQL